MKMMFNNLILFGKISRWSLVLAYCFCIVGCDLSAEAQRRNAVHILSRSPEQFLSNMRTIIQKGDITKLDHVEDMLMIKLQKAASWGNGNPTTDRYIASAGPSDAALAGVDLQINKFSSEEDYQPLTRQVAALRFTALKDLVCIPSKLLRDCFIDNYTIQPSPPSPKSFFVLNQSTTNGIYLDFSEGPIDNDCVGAIAIIQSNVR